MSNFILVYVQVSNFIQTQSIKMEGGGVEGGVQTCRHGGRLVEEAGGVQAGRWRRPSGAGIMEVARRQELLVAHRRDGGSAPGGVLLPV
jgi:hypothetical protein